MIIADDFDRQAHRQLGASANEFTVDWLIKMKEPISNNNKNNNNSRLNNIINCCPNATHVVVVVVWYFVWYFCCAFRFCALFVINKLQSERAAKRAINSFRFCSCRYTL